MEDWLYPAPQEKSVKHLVKTNLSFKILNSTGHQNHQVESGTVFMRRYIIPCSYLSVSITGYVLLLSLLPLRDIIPPFPVPTLSPPDTASTPQKQDTSGLRHI